jgi:hypothetical protein
VPEQPTAENGFSAKARPWARIGAFSALVGLGLAAGTLWDTMSNRIFRELRIHGECCAEFRQYKDEDSSQRHYWVDRIGENIKRIRDNERETDRAHARIDVLASDAKARPDPFTGTDGQRLEQRILRLEQKIDD